MKGKRHTPEQVLARLAEGDTMLNEGATIAEVARHFGITETTWHRWKNTYGGMKGQDVKRLKEREQSKPQARGHSGRSGPGHSHAKGAKPGKILTPDRRRSSVELLERRFGVSERRACRVVGQPRSTQRTKPRPVDDHQKSRSAIRRAQPVNAISSSIISLGLRQSSDFRGRPFSLSSASSRSARLYTLRSVPLGKNWRSKPLVFFFDGRCQGE
jgi:putative transposase